MSTLLTKLAADFTTQLAAAISIGGTTGTLLSQTDDDGNTLPDGVFVFTIDGSSSNKEYIRCTKTGTALTSIQSLSRQGALTSGVVKAHRIGASVSITDWAQLKYLTDLLSGATNLDATDPLTYDGTATITDSNSLATKAYVDGVAISGAPKATDSVYGITKLSVAAVSGTDPIAVGDNDTRVPTQSENDALQGTSGTPSNTNRYVTNDDTAENTASKLVRRKSDSNITVPTTPTATTDAVSKSYADSLSGGQTIPLGESFTGATTPQPCYIVNDLHQFRHGGFLSFGTNINSATGTKKAALKIVPQQNVTIGSILANIYKQNAPSDNCFITVETDSGGNPSGTVVTNGTSNNVAGSSLSTGSVTYQTFTFATPFSLTANTTYWVVFQRSGSLSGTDYYNLQYESSSVSYGAFAGRWSNTSDSWSAGNLPTIELIPSSVSGSYSLWQSDADGSTGFIDFFQGFCTTTGSAGASGTFIPSGPVSGFSGLIPNKDYYLSTTKGAITDTPSTSVNNTYVGTATSSSVLNVTPIKVGNPFAFTSQSSGAITYVTKIPYTGNLLMTVNASAVATMNVAGTNYVSFVGTSSVPTFIVPIKKGQYFNLSATGGSVGLTFQPTY